MKVMIANRTREIRPSGMKRGACGIVLITGVGLRPVGKPTESPPDPTIACAAFLSQPGGSPEGAGQSLTSLNSEEEIESVGKSESSIVAMKSGNADGAKGRRYWDNGSAKHAPTPSGLCA